MKAVVFSLGCKVNAYEGQAIVRLLEDMGLEASDRLGYADVYILNTCSVTAEADKKSRQAVERLLKYNRAAKLLVLGCSSQNDPTRYTINPNVTAVAGTSHKLESVRRFMAEVMGGEAACGYDFELPKRYEDDLEPACTRTRSYIKVQDGCDYFCSYCRIPYLRGRSRSRSIASIVEEANRLAEVSKEIILTGINVSDYHTEEGGLTELVRALRDVPARKRLSSFECQVVDEKLLDALYESGFCDHFHLSLQSGSDAVLKAMNRHYTAEQYLHKVRLIRERFPDAAITTDMIAGFPTETEENHLESLETARRAHFATVHVFPYSERAGTAAAKLPQIPKAERNRRAAELIALSAEMKAEFISANLGKSMYVYAETAERGISVGFTTNYIKVYSPLKTGELGLVKLIEPYNDGVKGELV